MLSPDSLCLLFRETCLLIKQTSIRPPSLLLLEALDSLLQGFHNAPEDHVELLVVERHELPAVQVLRLAHLLAQRGGLHLLGDEAYLVLAPLESKVSWSSFSERSRTFVLRALSERFTKP